MSDAIITVSNLGKRYRIAHQRERQRYVALRDVIAEKARRLFSRNQKPDATSSICPSDAGAEDFWALKDISFEIKRGEVVGIIGRNGAGKSTLLKILSRITEPTTGRVTLRGRVASLLEVGTGFHPELTGRENIFLNGAILGMSRTEIKQRFDEIVVFSGVEKFLDTPVKRYSSGMYVRLAFAVAAHLEPEILVVDEVLAVGDAEFQKKCLGKMKDVASGGRTVLFVSHNMAAIQALCPRVVLLEAGQLRLDDEKDRVVVHYLASGKKAASVNLAERTDREGNGTVHLTFVKVEAADGKGAITSTRGMKITIGYTSSQLLVGAKLSIGIYDGCEVGIYGLYSEVAGGLPDTLPSCGVVTCITAPVNLTAGPCSLNLAFYCGGTLADYVERAADFAIEPADFFGTGRTVLREHKIGLLHHKWSLLEA